MIPLKNLQYAIWSVCKLIPKTWKKAIFMRTRILRLTYTYISYRYLYFHNLYRSDPNSHGCKCGVDTHQLLHKNYFADDFLFVYSNRIVINEIRSTLIKLTSSLSQFMHQRTALKISQFLWNNNKIIIISGMIYTIPERFIGFVLRKITINPTN